MIHHYYPSLQHGQLPSHLRIPELHRRFSNCKYIFSIILKKKRNSILIPSEGERKNLQKNFVSLVDILHIYIRIYIHSIEHGIDRIYNERPPPIHVQRVAVHEQKEIVGHAEAVQRDEPRYTEEIRGQQSSVRHVQDEGGCRQRVEIVAGGRIFLRSQTVENIRSASEEKPGRGKGRELFGRVGARLRGQHRPVSAVRRQGAPRDGLELLEAG